MEFGPFRLDIIEDGRFELRSDAFTKLGGTSSSGSTPRVMIGFNSLLIRGNGQTILVDPGTGDKLLSDAFRAYRLEWPRKVFAGLEQLGVAKSDIDQIILTHLHWDHCGASTTVNSDGKLVPTFPNARYVVHRSEVEAARVSIDVGEDGGYQSADFEPLLEAGVLDQLSSDTEVYPGIRLEWVGGHSAGLQIVEIAAGDGRYVIYLSDLVPTAAQLPLDSIMSYDINVEELLASKRRVLERAIDRHDLLIFVHGPRTRAGYITKSADGQVVFARADFS